MRIDKELITVNSMKRKLSTLALAAGVAGGLGLAGPSAANAEPTGQYTYTCISTSGSSYLLQPGDELNTCKGSYLQKHINGVHVDTINLDGTGAPADPNGLPPLDCWVALAGAGVTVITTGGTAVWVASAAISLYGLKACAA